MMITKIDDPLPFRNLGVSEASFGDLFNPFNLAQMRRIYKDWSFYIPAGNASGRTSAFEVRGSSL
jgi:hypothetical protein